MKTIPVLLLAGYLGSGKTTLLNRILTNGEGIRFAVIVNDIGEVNIDASLIAKGGIVGGTDNSESLVALQNGCICCTLQMDLVNQLVDLVKTGQFDYIVIEASGICEPEPIARTIASIPSMGLAGITPDAIRLDCIVSVVDALRLKDEFESGSRLNRKKVAEEDLENLVIQQIEFCNIVLLNKVAEVTPKELMSIREVIKALQPDAEIIDTNYCDVPLDRLLNTHLFNYEKVATSATWVKEIEKPLAEDEQEDRHEHHHHEENERHEHGEHEHHHHEHGEEGHVCGPHCHHHHHHGDGEAEEYGISTFVYYARRPLSLNRFDRFIAKEWPKEVIRAKGVCYFAENKDMSYLFEQAGSQKKLTEAGLWYATAPEEELMAMMARDPGLMRDWDDKYGDRMQKIVFIGRGMNRKAITDALNECLSD